MNEQIIDVTRKALRDIPGIPYGGESRLAAEKIIAALDKAGFEIKRKSAK